MDCQGAGAETIVLLEVMAVASPSGWGHTKIAGRAHHGGEPHSAASVEQDKKASQTGS